LRHQNDRANFSITSKAPKHTCRGGDAIGIRTYGDALQVSTPNATADCSFGQPPPREPMNNAEYRSSANVLSVIVAAIVGFTILILVAVHGRVARTGIRSHNQECSEEASVFRPQTYNLGASSKGIDYKSHFNTQRHECLVEITISRSEDGSEADNEQIFDPSDGAFVASRDSVAAVKTDSANVTGAPVSMQEEAAAQAWFNDLMKK
jgi:hypothetical protein